MSLFFYCCVNAHSCAVYTWIIDTNAQCSSEYFIYKPSQSTELQPFFLLIGWMLFWISPSSMIWQLLFFLLAGPFFFFTLNALGQQLWLISWIFYLFFFSSSNWIFVREYFVEVYCLCVSLKFFRDFQWPWCWKPFLLANFVCVCGIFGSIESTQIHLKH